MIEQEVWVRLLVEFRSEKYPDLKQKAYYEVVDMAPDFPATNVLIDAHQRSSVDMEISIWHEDMPEGGKDLKNHFGNLTRH